MMTDQQFLLILKFVLNIVRECLQDSSSSSSSSTKAKGVGDHVPPQLSALRLCDKVHRPLFFCPFSDADKNLFSWTSLRSFSQYSCRCFEVFQSLPSPSYQSFNPCYQVFQSLPSPSYQSFNPCYQVFQSLPSPSYQSFNPCYQVFQFLYNPCLQSLQDYDWSFFADV